MSNEQIHQLPSLFYQLYKRLNQQLERDWKLDVSHIQFIALGYIYDHKQVPMKDLAAYLAITPASTSTMVKKLEAQGYLTRQEDAQDRRIFRLVLTDAGRAIYDACLDEARQQLETMLDHLSITEKTQLTSILTKMLAE